jgi:hypothetical protein
VIRKIVALVTTAALSLAAVVLVATPAAANPASPTLSVTVQPYAGGFRACAYGISSGGFALSHYSFDVNGAIVPLTTSITRDSDTFASPASPSCIYVWKLDDVSGGFSATLTFVSDGPDYANSVVGTGTWDPVLGDQVTSMRTCGDSGC